MYIAIDDTYGTAGDNTSKYVTSDRRTNLAVIFSDTQVKHIREQIRSCLIDISEKYEIAANEFHFYEIYNRTGVWKPLIDKHPNLGIAIFQAFAEIYSIYKWPVFLQTVDDRTLHDVGILQIDTRIDELDLTNREDLSLVMLICKIKRACKELKEPINLFIDEGRKKPGIPFGKALFYNWPASYVGTYQSSSEEPLLQIADFLAFCVNRNTHLQHKSERTDIDNWFINLVSAMGIDCSDLSLANLPAGFDTNHVDLLHQVDRIKKGIKS